MTLTLTFLTDIRIDNIIMPTMVYVHIKESKTDPLQKRSTICLAKADTELCTELALPPYLFLHGSHPGPLFIMQDHAYLTRAQTKLRVILKSADIDDSKYASHSFRSGAATTAAEVSIPNVHIKMLGRWKSEAYQIYVKFAPEKLANASKQLAMAVQVTLVSTVRISFLLFFFIVKYIYILYFTWSA